MPFLKDMPFQFIVQDIFDIADRPGPVVVGIIEEGTLRVNDQLLLVGDDKTYSVTATAIDKFQNEGLAFAEAGPDDVGIELTGISFTDVKKGFLLRKSAAEQDAAASP